MRTEGDGCYPKRSIVQPAPTRSELLSFDFMPEHVHALVRPTAEHADVSALLYAIERPFSFRVKQELERQRDPLLQTLTIRERPGKFVFRFWQEGPGYDRNLWTSAALIDAANYIHDNPARRRLCQKPDDWKWSSWRAIHCPELPPDSDLPLVHP